MGLPELWDYRVPPHPTYMGGWDPLFGWLTMVFPSFGDTTAHSKSGAVVPYNLRAPAPPGPKIYDSVGPNSAWDNCLSDLRSRSPISRNFALNFIKIGSFSPIVSYCFYLGSRDRSRQGFWWIFDDFRWFWSQNQPPHPLRVYLGVKCDGESIFGT